MRVLCYLLLSATIASAQTVPEGVTPVRDVWLQNFVPMTVGLERWDAGYLLDEDFLRAPAAVYRYDEEGRRQLARRLELPNAFDLRIMDMTARADGSMALALSAQAGDAGTYLAWLTPTGDVIRHLKVSPFAPRQIDFAPDGSLWVAGRIIDHSIRDPEDRPNHDILRHYAPDGTLLQTALDRDSFTYPTWQHPTAAQAFIEVQADGIGFYSDASKEWVNSTTVAQSLAGGRGC